MYINVCVVKHFLQTYLLGERIADYFVETGCRHSDVESTLLYYLSQQYDTVYSAYVKNARLEMTRTFRSELV